MYSRALRATTALCYLAFEYVLVLDAWFVRGGLLVCAWDTEGVGMEDRDKCVWVWKSENCYVVTSNAGTLFVGMSLLMYRRDGSSNNNLFNIVERLICLLHMTRYVLRLEKISRPDVIKYLESIILSRRAEQTCLQSLGTLVGGLKPAM